MDFSNEQLSYISDMYLRGEDLHKIASEVGAHPTDVLLALQEVYERLQKSVPFKFDKALVMQLCKLDKAESEAWRSWEKSKQPKMRKNSKATKGDVKANVTENKDKADDKKPDKIEQSVITEEREGSAMYLNIVLTCIKTRVDLLRLK